MVKWSDGQMVKWSNGQVVRWSNGQMVSWSGFQSLLLYEDRTQTEFSYQVPHLTHKVRISWSFSYPTSIIAMSVWQGLFYYYMEVPDK